MARGRRLLVIGAGPIGLEAAPYALRLGYEVRVLEGGRIGENVRSWGHASPTGREYVSRYLLPLGSCPPLLGIIRERTRVIAVSRDATTKEDYPGEGARALRPFRVLSESGGREDLHEADVVLDVSGTYGRPRALGNGGIAAPGERQTTASPRSPTTTPWPTPPPSSSPGIGPFPGP